LQGLGSEIAPTDRALPYPDDYKAFSLNLMAVAGSGKSSSLRLLSDSYITLTCLLSMLTIIDRLRLKAFNNPAQGNALRKGDITNLSPEGAKS